MDKLDGDAGLDTIRKHVNQLTKTTNNIELCVSEIKEDVRANTEVTKKIEEYMIWGKISKKILLGIAATLTAIAAVAVEIPIIADIVKAFKH